MKNWMKAGILIVLVYMMVPAVAQQSQAVRFGHVDFNAIVEAMPETKAADQAVENRSKELEAEMERMYNELELLFQEYQQNAAGYSAQMRSSKENQITAKQNQLAEKEQAIEEELQKLWSDRMEVVYDKVNKAIDAVARENGYLYIFDSRSIRFAMQPGNDITSLVKRRLGVS